MKIQVKHSKRILPIIIGLMLFLATLTGCDSNNASSDNETTNPKQASAAVDYSQPEHWLAVPDNPTLPADIFYLYPTVWQKTDDTEGNICAIDNESMLAGAARVLDIQASAYQTVGNIYAPYYRQADAAYLLSLPLDEQDESLASSPKADVFAALDYYFENYNQGRPFILAGHSQGSDLLLYVLSEYLGERPEIYQRMIAAYVIGYSVTEDFLAANPHLKFAQGPDDTGVIISYNTEAPDVTSPNPVLLEGALAINPISWTTEETPASAQESLGSRIDGERKQAFADATVDQERGVVICSTVDPSTIQGSSSIFGEGIFHSQDYPFYYYDIRANAELRVQNYLNNQGN